MGGGAEGAPATDDPPEAPQQQGLSSRLLMPNAKVTDDLGHSSTW